MDAAGNGDSCFAGNREPKALQHVTDDDSGIFQGNYSGTAGCAEDGVWQDRSCGLGKRFDDVQIAAHGLFAGICGGKPEQPSGLCSIMSVSEDSDIHGIAGGNSRCDCRANCELLLETETSRPINITGHGEGSNAGSSFRLLLRPCVCCSQQQNAESRSSLQVHGQIL